MGCTVFQRKKPVSEPWLWCTLACWNRKGASQNYSHKNGSSLLSKIPLYSVALRFPSYPVDIGNIIDVFRFHSICKRYPKVQQEMMEMFWNCIFKCGKPCIRVRALTRNGFTEKPFEDVGAWTWWRVKSSIHSFIWIVFLSFVCRRFPGCSLVITNQCIALWKMLF